MTDTDIVTATVTRGESVDTGLAAAFAEGNTTTKADRAKDAIEAGDQSLHDAAEAPAIAQEDFESEKVTATVSSGARPGGDTPTLAEFMSAVVAWPLSPEDPGYVNLHYSSVNRDNPNGSLRKGSGWPFRDLGSFVSRAVWINTTAQFKDVWYCLSLQSQTRPNPRAPTKPKAHRLAANALKVKSIWIDVDVGDDPKKYGTVEEALKAVLLFQKTAGLPTPSAIVYSGGGIHVYWISKDPLTREQWLPYASGLKTLLLTNAVKCDTGLTTDIARILRVPGTFNHKYDPPKPVMLAPLSLIMYDFAKLDFLKQFAAPTMQAAKPQHNIFADGITDAQRASFTQPPPFKVGEPDLNAGIDKFDDTSLKVEPIFKQCGFYKEALLTGGANYNQELWMYSVLGATFMENGNAVAHAISKGHASYTPAETEEMYDRKVADRRDRGIGYPQCATIQGAGCQACAACPHFQKGKSPLNLGYQEQGSTEAGASAGPAETPRAEPSFVDPYADFIGPEFPLDILPPTLAAFVDAQHRAMGADPSAIAMAAITAIAGAMHAETRVRVGEGWSEKPIIWTALLGLPSTMKSPIIDKSTKPLSLINHERDNHWRAKQAKWAQIPNNKAIRPPKPARCVINDATAEKVAELLSRDPSGSLMVHDELAGWLGGFERYSTGQSSRALYLTAWNGGTFLKDRVGKGITDLDAEVRVENLALCILGGIQPDRLIKLGDLTSDGLLQRFLTVLMKSAKLGDPYYPVAGAEAEYEKLIRSISNLPAQNYHFADEAFEVRDDVRGYLHKLELVDGFPPSLIGAIGKLNGYFARICLVLHVARHQDVMMGNKGQSEPLPASFTGGPSEDFRKLFELSPNDCLSAGIVTSSAISRGTAEAAKKMLLEFLLPHVIGLYDVVVNGGQDRDKLRTIANFILASDKDRLRPSDFTAGVRGLRGEPEPKIREWVGRFCSMDWLSPEEGKPGVPTKAWQVSPGLRDHFTERRKQVRAARAEMHAILKAGGSRKVS